MDLQGSYKESSVQKVFRLCVECNLTWEPFLNQPGASSVIRETSELLNCALWMLFSVETLHSKRVTFRLTQCCFNAETWYFVHHCGGTSQHSSEPTEISISDNFGRNHCSFTNLRIFAELILLPCSILQCFHFVLKFIFDGFHAAPNTHEPHGEYSILIELNNIKMFTCPSFSLVNVSSLRGPKTTLDFRKGQNKVTYKNRFSKFFDFNAILIQKF